MIGNRVIKNLRKTVKITETYKKRVLIVDGEEVELKSKRAKICRQTNTAIEKFDHYCPWTGNAIGRRNYPYFFGFICSTTLLSLIVFVTSVICIFGQTGAKGGFTRYMESNTYIVTVQVIVSIYAIILFLTLVGLTTYHINLVCRNITTNEDLKGVYSLNKINEHDQGMLKNINSILFSPTPPSKVKEGNNNNMTNPAVARIIGFHTNNHRNSYSNTSANTGDAHYSSGRRVGT